MALEQYDKWVIGNQKRILDWTKKYSTNRYAPIRDAFANYNNAKSNKQKLKAFENLKKELVSSKGIPFEDLANKDYKDLSNTIQKYADRYTQGDISALDRNSNIGKLLNRYDLLTPISDAMNSLPSKPKDYSYVELDKAFQDNYNYDEMVALANQYNYDWTDKEDRKEFIKALAEIEQARLKEEAYNPQDFTGALTQLAYPVTFNYAKNNEDKIRTDGPSIGGVPLKGVGDLWQPLLADASSQIAMMEGAAAGKTLGGIVGQGAVGKGLGELVAAPVLTEYGQVMANDKPVTDALQDAAAGTVLNSVGPATIMGMASRFYRPGATPNATAKALANKYADDYRTMIRLQHEQPYTYINKPEQGAYEAAKLKYINANAKKILKDNPELTPLEATKQASTGKNLADAEAYGEGAVAQVRENNKYKAQKTGKTGVYKKNPIYQTKELTPEQVLNNPDNVMQITPEMQAKEQMLYRWKNRPQGTDEAKYKLAMKKANNEPITVDDLVKAGYTESVAHKIYNSLKHNTTEPIKNIGFNLGAANRLAGRRIDAFGRNINFLPGKYGESEPEIDWDDPKVKAYKAAYERYKSNEDFYQKPKKPAGLKNETVKKIEKIFGD